MEVAIQFTQSPIMYVNVLKPVLLNNAHLKPIIGVRGLEYRFDIDTNMKQ